MVEWDGRKGCGGGNERRERERERGIAAQPKAEGDFCRGCSGFFITGGRRVAQTMDLHLNCKWHVVKL